MGPIDTKFLFEAICIEHGDVFTHYDAMVFLTKDKALPATLRFYREECERLGAAPEQLKAIDLLTQRVIRYQEENPELVKVADIDLPDTGRPAGEEFE